MQDNAPTTEAGGQYTFGVSWKGLIESLVEFIGITRIKTQCTVQRVQHKQVYAHCGHETIVWNARQHILIAVPNPPLRRLLPWHLPLQYLHHQPFVRVYAVLDKPILGLKGYTVVTNELQKVIPMNQDGTLVMIAYADNAAARTCWRAAARYDKAWFERRLNEAFHLQGNTKCKISKLYHKYWKAAFSL